MKKLIIIIIILGAVFGLILTMSFIVLFLKNGEVNLLEKALISLVLFTALCAFLVFLVIKGDFKIQLLDMINIEKKMSSQLESIDRKIGILIETKAEAFSNSRAESKMYNIDKALFLSGTNDKMLNKEIKKYFEK